MLRRFAIFCLLTTCAFGLSINLGCSSGPTDVNMEEAMDNKDKKLGEGDGTKFSDHEGGVQVD